MTTSRRDARPEISSVPARLAVFDVDGTLYSAETGLPEEINRRTVAVVREIAQTDHRTAQALFETYGREYGLAVVGLHAHFGVDIGELLAHIHDIPYVKYLQRNGSLCQILQRLPMRKIAFSNAPRRHVICVIGALGVDYAIDTIIAFEDLFPAIKPELASFAEVARISGVEFQEMVLFEDNPHVAAAAYHLGIKVYLVGSDRRIDVPGVLRFPTIELAIMEAFPGEPLAGEGQIAEGGQPDDC
jgi:putative hydrolase of the HAD superfamily